MSEPLLHAHLLHDTHLVDFKPLTITLRVLERAPKDLTLRLTQLLKSETGDDWTIAISDKMGHPSLAETQEETLIKHKEEVAQKPLVKATLLAFPGAELTHIEQRKD